MNGNKEAKKIARPKTWEELTETEKIEKLKQIVDSLSHEIERHAQTIRKLVRHQHMPSGEMVVPIEVDDILF